MWIDLLLLVGGLFLLIKGADVFVDSSVDIAKMFNLSEMFIGMTLVCFGTGLPELLLSVIGNIRGSSDIAIGNMVGSNIFNVCAILGVICLINPVKLLNDTVRKDMYMSLVTGIVFLLVLIDVPFGFTDINVVTRADGLILLVLFAIYIYYTMYHFEGITVRRRRKKEQKLGQIQEKKEKLTIDKRDLCEKIFVCIIGAILVYVGSEAVVNGVVDLAGIFNISETFISIMVLAVGTSLPETVTSIVAIKKGSINVAIGNLIGSSMYNMLFVIGVTSLINPLIVTQGAIWIDCLVFIFISLIMVSFAKSRFVYKGQYEISRTEGIVLLVTYVCYVIYVVFRG